MKKTALNDKHLALGAKMVPFAGYDMPVQYTNLGEEHLNVRNGVGVFDVSHMGEFFVSGPGSLDLIQRVTTNDASKLTPGKVQYSCLPNEEGGIVDDLLVYCLAEDDYMLVVNASNMEKDWNWISKFNTENVKMTDLSDNFSLLAIQGPKATEAIASLTDIDIASMPYYTVQVGTFAGQENVIVATTGYTGSGGYEIYFTNDIAEKVWDAVFEAGKSVGIAPAGLGARDTLRMEMGFCLYGNDIDDTTSPHEAGLGWITKYTKEFTNSEALKAQKEAGVTRKLVGFHEIEKGPIPRQGYEIQDIDGNVIGHVTSGTKSPSMDKAIAMGYVKKEFSAVDTEVRIIIRNKSLSAKVCRFPFLKLGE
ncbi:MAG TPA: glycine cleavage system aminomethyltransferase GcvT [Flavobacteriales bacterium]|jgi:aminomethyltransferase|nr:glycine cleavage system aminomethyltransferase GcvT [Flavobacteriales bacterium]HAW19574.1 glycine cleavage system aminomethyltransferase GcvT [Flavobacteriales bacterium]